MASPRRDVAARLAPFASAALLTFALVPIGAEVRWFAYLLALAMTIGVIAATILTPWRRVPSDARIVLPLMFLAASFLLRDAAGGSTAGVGMLALLPVFWVALHGTPRQLAVIVIAAGLGLAAPAILIGGDAYPPAGLRFAAVFTVIAGTIGASVQQLVRMMRRQRAALEARELVLRETAHEREALVAELERLASTDPLTGLGNRRAWDERIAAALEGAAPAGAPVAVAMLDLDHFKQFNDRHGHEAGDRLLRRAAGAWSAELRPGDHIARLGGEEFAVLLVECPAECATRVIDRLRRATPAGQTCSAGLAAWDGFESAAELLARADVALYDAKRAGRDRSCVASRTTATHGGIASADGASAGDRSTTTVG